MFSFGTKKADRRREMTAASVRRPKLEQRNASKKIDCEVPWASNSWRKSPALVTHYLDLSPSDYSDKTSFRIGGSVEGEVDILCRSLGLSGPEDFAIPAAAWEASLKARSSCDLVFRAPFVKSESSPQPPENLASSLNRLAQTKVELPRADISRSSACGIGGGNVRIKGTRPTVLATSPAAVSILCAPPGKSVLVRPPFIKLPALDRTSPKWDLVRSFAPPDENNEGCKRNSSDSIEEEKVRAGVEFREVVEEMGAISGETSEDCTGRIPFGLGFGVEFLLTPADESGRAITRKHRHRSSM